MGAPTIDTTPIYAADISQEPGIMSVIRAFLAITLSAEIQNHLDTVITGLRQRMGHVPVRWVQAKNIHLTIKFLGDVSVASQAMLTSSLQSEATRHTPFEISVGSLGVFPNPRKARVLWVGVEAPQELYALVRGVEYEMARLGYPTEDRPYSPHLTIGRVSRNATESELRKIGDQMGSYKVGFLGALRVDTIDLYRSDLHPEGAVYSRLFQARLGQPERT